MAELSLTSKEALLLLSSNADVFQGAIEALVARLITLGAMGALGAYYWRIQRRRRRAASNETVDSQPAPAVS